MDAFCFTLSSALSAGHNPALQDRKGRNALFIMCERLSLFSAGERTAEQPPTTFSSIEFSIDFFYHMKGEY